MKGEAYFDTKKSEVQELRAHLQDRSVQKDKEKYRTVVQKVIAFMTLGIDVSSLFMDMIMASATSDIVQKKMVYLYICTHAESNSELALLTINTLQKDAGDENAMIRGLALRSMLSLRIRSLVEHVKKPLLNGLTDRNAYVRKTAVLGTLKLFYLCPEVIQELEIVTKLYNMIRDHDGQVCLNSVLALDEIEAGEGGIKLRKELVAYLYDRLHGLNEWSQCMLMEILARYQPDTDEIYDYMNTLDDRLNHSNKAVVLSAAKLFLLYGKYVEHIAVQVFSRLRGPLLTLLSVRSPEMIFNGLNHIIKVVQAHPTLFSKDFKSFFLRQSDPTYVKEKKLEVLTYIVTDKNMELIIEELKEYVNDPDVALASRAIDCIGMIAVSHQAALPVCLRTLVELISLEVDYLTSNVMEQMGRLLLKYGDVHHTIIPHIEACFDMVSDHPKGKASMIWILGHYGEHIPSSPYLLEEIIDKIGEEQSATVKSQLLTATMKLYFKRPPECQRMLVKLLKNIIDNEVNMDVRDRALFYFRLLKYNLDVAKEIVLNDYIKMNQEQASPLESKALVCSEFNTLSTIYGLPAEQFISPCVPYMRDSNAKGTSGKLASEQGPGASVGSGSGGEKRSSKAKVASSPPKVEVADLLGELSLLGESESTPTQMKLAPSVKVTPAEYEKIWIETKHQTVFDRPLTVIPRKEELEVVMSSRNIFTMASSPPEDPVVKFFYFCKEMSSKSLVLIELNVYKEHKKMDGTIKCSSQETLSQFSEFFQDLFVGKWIAFT